MIGYLATWRPDLSPQLRIGSTTAQVRRLVMSMPSKPMDMHDISECADIGELSCDLADEDGRFVGRLMRGKLGLELHLGDAP